MAAKWWYRLARLIYGLEDEQFSRCDIVVPLGYGLTKDGKLPDGAKKTFIMAAIVAAKFNSSLAWASSNYFWPGCKEQEDTEKSALLESLNFNLPRIIAEGITNSVSEARKIKKALVREKVMAQIIVVVCDWLHARSAKLIWEKIFPDAEITFLSVEGKWGKTHAAILQQSDFRWLITCILRHLALILLGVERVANFQHPVR